MKAAQLLDGAKIAQDYLREASRQIELLSRAGVTLTLATVQVGESKDTVLYAKSLERLFRQNGIRCLASISPAGIAEAELVGKIRQLNQDPAVTGILVFSPLPPSMNAARVLSAVDPSKDVEGRTFLKNHFGVFSPTANAVLTLIEKTSRDITGKTAVVIGHSDLVGKPTAVLLMDRFATVTVCHAKTRGLKEHVRSADIVVGAAGKPALVKGKWIKKGAIVIDVGENIVNGRLIGDVEAKTAATRAAFISPVPGGVGPLTNVMLVRNLLKLHRLKTDFGR